MRVGRRTFCQACVSCALASMTSCRGTPKREAVLEAIVREVVAPDTTALVVTSRRLADSVHRLAEAPSQGALGVARAEWKNTTLAWRRAYGFRNGPIVEQNALLRAAFWPARLPAIEAVIAGEKAIDDGLVEELGADSKGLFALEHLLFPLGCDDAATLARWTGPIGNRALPFADAIGRSVVAYADGVSRALGDGSAYAATFAKGGQPNLNRLVNQMADTLESNVLGRLMRVLDGERNHQLGPSEVEGWPSGTSHEIVLAHLEASRRFYRDADGARLGDLVKAVAPAIDDRLIGSWAKAIDLVRSFGAPLERAVKNNTSRFMDACQAARDLEVAVKTGMASSLGVTLTFSAGDGD
jgi:predicted lipoprotein